MKIRFLPLVAALLLLGAVQGASSAGTSAETTLCADQGTSSEFPTGEPRTFESLVIYDGTATTGGDSSFVRFCGQDTMAMDVTLTWKGGKDLRLTVIDPAGNVSVVDGHYGNNFEIFQQGAPLTHGDWEIMVSTNGRGSANYRVVTEFR